MFKFFIKYVMQHTLFKESDSANLIEQAQNTALFAGESAGAERRQDTQTFCGCVYLQVALS